MDLMFLEDNPVRGRKRRRKKATGTKKRRRRRTATTAATPKRRRRRTRRGTQAGRRRRKSTQMGGSVSGKRRRRRTRRGSPIISSTPKATTQGRRRRRKSSTMLGKTYRRRRTRRGGLGQGITFKGIFDDMLSIASIAGGIIGSAYIQKFIMPVLKTSPTQMTKLLVGLGTYGLGYALDHFVKPSQGVFENIITGVKIGGILSVLETGIQLLMGKTTMDTAVDVETIPYAKTLGEGFLVQDGEIYPLSGQSRRFVQGANPSMIDYNSSYYDSGMSKIDSEINNLMKGSVIDVNKPLSRTRTSRPRL